jgi:hypothetical protein
MTKYNTNPGFSGSELERATMASCTFPMETVLERSIKRQIAKGLTDLANYIYPSSAAGFEVRKIEQHC